MAKISNNRQDVCQSTSGSNRLDTIVSHAAAPLRPSSVVTLILSDASSGRAVGEDAILPACDEQ
jgi:hypothetical protein